MRLHQLYKMLSLIAIVMVLGHLFTPHSHAQPNRSFYCTHESHTFFEKCLEIFSIDLGEQHLTGYRADAVTPDLNAPVSVDYSSVLMYILRCVKCADATTSSRWMVLDKKGEMDAVELSVEPRRGPPTV